MRYPQSLQELIDSFQKFPGVGPKTAERMALFTILHLKKEEVVSFSNRLVRAKESIGLCKECGALSDGDVCNICTDDSREPTLLVVEDTKDVISIERTNQYHGKYHVLNGVISPLNGVGPDDINLGKLFLRMKNEEISEVIVATNATIEGETTALYIKKMAANLPAKITRIGYGLPAGGDIEYADEITLTKSLEGRKEIT